jgi:hypothetical protein
LSRGITLDFLNDACRRRRIAAANPAVSNS